MSAFVYAGEYSTACVCQPRAATASAGTGGTDAATVGVITQVRNSEQQQMAAHH